MQVSSSYSVKRLGQEIRQFDSNALTLYHIIFENSTSPPAMLQSHQTTFFTEFIFLCWLLTLFPSCGIKPKRTLLFTLLKEFNLTTSPVGAQSIGKLEKLPKEASGSKCSCNSRSHSFPIQFNQHSLSTHGSQGTGPGALDLRLQRQIRYSHDLKAASDLSWVNKTHDT